MGTPSSNWTSTQLFPHIDYAASVAATVGLGDFNGTAVGFYAARGGLCSRTVLRDLGDVAEYKLRSLPRFAMDPLATGSDSAAATAHFELLLQRELRANRALAYPAWLLHRAVVPEEVAQRLSPDPEHGRLTLNLFYTTEDHPVRRGQAPPGEPSDEELREYVAATTAS